MTEAPMPKSELILLANRLRKEIAEREQLLRCISELIALRKQVNAE